MARKVKQPHGGSITLAQKGDVLNPKGPTPKLLSTITAELKAKGYERATANQVADAFETLMNVPQNELADMVKDEKAPMSLRIVGKAMLTAKGWEVLQAMLDRAHGKAKQQMDLTTGGNPIPAPVINLAHDRPQSQAD
jgi:hypothetical protein